MPKYENEEVGDIYSDNFNETLEEEDEITEAEEGFMQGYNEDDLVKECANCQNILDENYIEHEFNNKKYGFCSKKCLREFLSNQA